MIAIHRGSDILLEVGVNQGSIRRFNLMKDDFIRLKFSLTTNTPLLIGDYVDLTGYINSCDNENFRIKDSIADQTTKKFVLDRNYYPTFNKDTGGWDYDVQINAYYHQWKNKIFMFNPSKGAAESSFSLTDTIFTHATLLVNNLKYARFTYNDTEFDVAYQEEFEGQLQAKGMKPITYSAVSIYGVLDMIAQAFECEWWLDGGSTIYFGYRKGDESITLTLNEEIADTSISDSDGVHATRIYAFGGTTNVPKHYRDKLEFKVSEIVNTSVGNTFRDTSKPITSNWFRGKYSEQPIIMNFEGEAINSGGYICQKYYSAPLSAGNIEGTIKGLSMTFEPTIYGYYEDSDIWPSLDIEVALDVTDEHWLYRQSQPKQVLLRKCSTMNGTAIGGVYNGNFKYADGAIKKYTSNTESGNGMVGISSFPIEAGKYYAVHIEDTAYSELLDYFILFSESNVAEGITVSELWSFDKKKKYGFYYKAEKNGYLLIPQPSYTKATPIVKEVERVRYDLFESPYNFQWVYDTISWSNILLRVDIMDGANGVHDLATSVHHNVKYRVITSDWSIEAQRADKAVDTIIIIGGEERECTINPLFASSTNGHLIRIDGYTPKIGDVFTFPNIVINRVEPSYFSPEDDGVQNGVVQKNLMLPIGTNYVQADGVSDANVVEAIMVYDWIYPKTALKVTKVEPFKEWEVEIEDGQTIHTTTYDITLPIEDYEDDLWVDPSKMFAIFQSGEAAGLRFELRLVSNKLTPTSVTFRLVPNEDYSITVPNEATIPAIDDEIILEGIDISFLSGSAISEAEEQLLDQANKDILETSKEDKVVDITLKSTDAYNRGRIALGTLTSLVGVLSSEDGAYDSRVLGFEECLDIPWDKPKYIIGDRNYYNRQASIESKLENIEKGSITLSGVNIGGGGSNIPIIKVKDSTKPTDANVYSALRSREEFAKRKEEETFSEKVTFNKDIDVKGSTKTKNLSVSNDANIGGNQTIQGKQTIGNNIDSFVQEVKGKQLLHGGFQTPNFNNAGGQIAGAQLTSAGLLTVAGLIANSFTIKELIYNVIRAQGGTVTYSPCANIEQCVYVIDRGTEDHPDVLQLTPDEYYASYEDTPISYVLLTIKKEEVNKNAVPFRNADILYGYVNQIGESGQYARGGQCVMHVISPDEEIGLDGSMVIKAKLYSSAVTDNNGHQIVGNMPPTNGMTVAQRGNEKGTEGRTSAFFIDSAAGNIIMLQNITTPVIGRGNYGVIIGQLPDDMLSVIPQSLPVRKYDPVVYAKNAIFENFIQLDHQGTPIPTARDRGQWDKKTANGNIENRYKSEATYYDTVTYKGELWKCIESDTTDEPSYTSEGWLLLVSRGESGTSTSYWLYTDVPHVHINANGVPDATAINITVYKSSEDGIIALTTKEQIEAEGLAVQYSIDSTAPRENFELVDDGIIELEDGSGYIVGESDTQTTYLYTESDAIPFADVNKYIMFWLYDTNEDKDIDSLKVEISRDGVADTIDTIEYAVSTTDSMSEVPTSWQDEKPHVTTGHYLWTKITYTPSGKVTYSTSYNGKDGASGKQIYINSELSTIVANTGTVITSSGSQQVQVVQEVSKSFVMTCIYDGKPVAPTSYNVSSSPYITSSMYLAELNVAVKIPVGTLVTKIPSSINVSMSVLDGDVTTTANFDVVIMQSQRGLDGPQGEAGPLYVPFGTWSKKDAEDEKYNVDTERAQALPLVYYQPDKKERGEYYIHGGDNGKIKEGKAPSEVDSGWKWATSQPYLLADMLMANFAKLGSEYGAVFYHKYLFSQHGIGRKEDGGYMDGSAHYSSFYEKMFDIINGDPTLNGGFIPSFFVDFLSGESKMNRLSLPFYDLPYGEEEVSYKIDLGVSHSVKADINKVVFLPNPTKTQNENVKTYEPDGVLCTIYAKPKPNYTELYKTPYARLQMKDTVNIPSIYTLDDSLTLVCADGRVSDYSSYYTEDIDVGGNKNKVVYNPLKSNFNTFGQYDGMGYFLIEGVPVKFIVLEPGAILKLRSCYTTAGRYEIPATGNGYAKKSEGIFWVVENASDFAQINFMAEIYLDKGEYQTAYVWSCPSNPDEYDPQIEIAYGSSFIRYVQGKGTDSLQSSDMLKARIYVTAEGINIDDSLFVNQ